MRSRGGRVLGGSHPGPSSLPLSLLLPSLCQRRDINSKTIDYPGEGRAGVWLGNRVTPQLLQLGPFAQQLLLLPHVQKEGTRASAPLQISLYQPVYTAKLACPLWMEALSLSLRTPTGLGQSWGWVERKGSSTRLGCWKLGWKLD